VGDEAMAEVSSDQLSRGRGHKQMETQKQLHVTS